MTYRDTDNDIAEQGEHADVTRDDAQADGEIVIDGDHEAKTRASKYGEDNEGGLRPFADITAREWARYQRAKAIRDPQKLAALVPASSKPWARPARHDKGEFSFAELRHVPNAPARLPNLATRELPIKRAFPGWDCANSTAQYVAEFCRKNNLMHA